MKEPILSREEVKTLYSKHFANPYDLLPLWAEAFAAALESALLEKLCGEPRAWLVEGGRMYRDKAFIDASNADTSIAERNDGARKTALYALNRSKA
ncbi:TPA: hypothetical protein QDA94_003035 [Burkholderia vietnamiensis]|nr:hypothetical protein [Burkholderia vietnamiensis]HDR9231363.1 hypothetical protein [Burkholderia vietnamiensis]